ncbi:exocyst complex component 4 isoform X2 [Dermacentor albipictus]|uniref:exocyst complex component 4 isoform X2 n=1 Tax=Dermacentor albipictus TaxID=60249 RepID=UPI0031FDA8A0
MANYVTSSGGPVRPPRTFKTTKDSNGLLISVIRSLSASQNSADRDREKAKLEKDFKRSDQKLDDLVAQNKEDLTRAMQDFSKISSRISASRSKVQCIKEKLTTCKTLLHCKRDELKKLWLEAVEHKHVLQLLEEIESLVEVPDKIDAYLSKKQYLHATQLLVSSVNLVEGSLEGVEALKDVKGKLIFKKERMYEDLVDELHRHLYLRRTTEALQKFRRQSSDRKVQFGSIAQSRSALLELVPLVPGQNTSPQELRNSSTATLSSAPSSITAGDTETSSLLKLEESGQVGEAPHLAPKYTAILVRCLALLNRIPDTVELIKERCQTELLAMVRRTTQVLLDTSNGSAQTASALQPRLLLDLLDLLFEQFHTVATGHECVLTNMHAMVDTQGPDNGIPMYSLADVWARIQAVMEYVVGKYLDIHNTGSAQQVPPPVFTDMTATNDIASYFTRRRNVKQKKFALFRFDCSSHAISMNTYLKEKKEEMKDKCDYVEVADSHQQLVCVPTSKNITYIFKPLMNFITDIEAALKLEDGNHCHLYEYLVECVKIFLGHVNNDLDNTIDNATKSLETWKVTSDAEILKSHGIVRPLLQSTLCVDQSLQGLQELMQALPMYVEHFLSLACTILYNYKQTSQVAYRGIVQPESEDKRIISATWAKDEDISRFLMSLPNWANLQLMKENRAAVDVEESPEEVRLRNKKESEILIGNLASGTLIPPHEILSDVAQLRVLAQLQESLVQDLPPVPDATVQTLEELAKDFQEIADTCLLVLHLEVRVHCFFYLLPVTIQGNFAGGVDSQEPDPEVMKLNKDLSSIDEAMTACLQQRKHRYIFEGLGHLIASILINSTSSIQKVNENGIKKVCRNIFAMQQTLTSITMNREVALDYARQYFELFYYTPEDILNLIVEHGAQFQEMEYKNVLLLLHRSLPSSDRDPDSLDALLSRLRDILNEVAVAI